MTATEKEQKCIDFANQIRLDNAPELSYVWLIGTWRTDEQIAYANKIIKNDPPFKFEEVKAHYANNYDVCGDKTFSNLWDTKGLRNYGVNYWNNISVANEDLLLCQGHLPAIPLAGLDQSLHLKQHHQEVLLGLPSKENDCLQIVHLQSDRKLQEFLS